MKKLFILFALAFVGALGFGIYLSFQTQDLSDLSGRHETDRELTPADVPSMIESAAKSRKGIVISERQINTWLANTLKARQEGSLADHVEIKGVWVRFDEAEGGRVEIIIEREIKGRPQTVSMFVRIERKKKEDGTFTTYIHKDGGRLWGLLAVGGKFGQARVPQGFLFFTQSSFSSLSDLFKKELEWMEEDITKRAGGRIIFEEDQMRIDFPPPSPSIIPIPRITPPHLLREVPQIRRRPRPDHRLPRRRSISMHDFQARVLVKNRRIQRRHNLIPRILPSLPRMRHIHL